MNRDFLFVFIRIYSIAKTLMKLKVISILICIGLCFVVVSESNAQTRKITKRVGVTSLYPYSPKSTYSLNDIPINIVEKVTEHLKNRLGEEFYKKLKFSYGVIVNFDDLKRANPTANYQWKVFTYKLEYQFSMPEVGIKLYEASIWLNEKGDVIREIDLPAIAQDPEKAKIISVKDAIKIGKNNNFSTNWVELAYREEDDSIVWQLRRNGNDSFSYRLDISAHTGKILYSVGFKGIS